MTRRNGSPGTAAPGNPDSQKWEQEFFFWCDLENSSADAGKSGLNAMRRAATRAARNAYLGCSELSCSRRPTQLDAKPESLHSFGFFPEDFLLDNIPPGIIVGLRTAGSFLAPLLATRNKREYMTLRPGKRARATRQGNQGTPFLLSPDEAGALSRLRGPMVLVDEGPGTGLTLNAVIRYFLVKGVSRGQISVVCTRPYYPAELPEENIILVQQSTFHVRVRENARSLGISVDSVRPLRPANTINGYSNPKMVLGRSVIAKFIGAGPFGAAQFARMERIREYSPQIIGFARGVLFQHATREHPIDTETVFAYAKRWMRSFTFELSWYRRFIDEFNALLDLGMNDWSPRTSFDDKLRLLVGRLRHVLRGRQYWCGEIDWKQEPEKWHSFDGRVVKLDPFHQGDYASHPPTGILVQVLGGLLESGLAVADAFNFVQERLEVCSEECVLSASFYLYWRMAYYNYIREKTPHAIQNNLWLAKREKQIGDLLGAVLNHSGAI